jgi:hypothetical protein
MRIQVLDGGCDEPLLRLQRVLVAQFAAVLPRGGGGLFLLYSRKVILNR